MKHTQVSKYYSFYWPHFGCEQLRNIHPDWRSKTKAEMVEKLKKCYGDDFHATNGRKPVIVIVTIEKAGTY